MVSIMEPEIMEDILKMISTVGFPIAVCVFLLLERSKTTKALIKAIQDLTIMIKTRLK